MTASGQSGQGVWTGVIFMTAPWGFVIFGQPAAAVWVIDPHSEQ